MTGSVHLIKIDFCYKPPNTGKALGATRYELWATRHEIRVTSKEIRYTKRYLRRPMILRNNTWTVLHRTLIELANYQTSGWRCYAPGVITHFQQRAQARILNYCGGKRHLQKNLIAPAQLQCNRCRVDGAGFCSIVTVFLNNYKIN